VLANILVCAPFSKRRASIAVTPTWDSGTLNLFAKDFVAADSITFFVKFVDVKLIEPEMVSVASVVVGLVADWDDADVGATDVDVGA